jgi:hypothetical protein
MIKMTVLLPDELKRSLQAIARERGISQSAVIREALEAQMDTWARPLPRSVGMVSDGSFDAARDEEYLAEHWIRHLSEEMGSR